VQTGSSWSLARRILALQAVVLVVVLGGVLVALYFITSAQTAQTTRDRVVAVASTVAAAPSVRAAVTATYPAGQEITGPSAAMEGYANDVMAYIPSVRVLNEGGYEGGGAMVYYGFPTVWAPEVEEMIVRTVHALAESESGKVGR